MYSSLGTGGFFAARLRDQPAEGRPINERRSRGKTRISRSKIEDTQDTRSRARESPLAPRVNVQ